MTTEKDLVYMGQALDLARKAVGRISPNPMVGSIVVQDGSVVGRGYYHEYGAQHAEPQALLDASGQTRGAVMYVTLEPCCHQGKTPPCTNAIINAGIESVYIAMVDPDPRVSGKGIEQLRAAGISVDIGLLEAEAQDLNKTYIHHRKSGNPYVSLKLAQTLDGCIAAQNGSSKWISGKAARERVHLMRSRVDAVLIGIETLLKDDPQLTVRHVDGRQPRRVILDSLARTPINARLLTNEAPTTIFVSNKASSERIEELRRVGANVMVMPDDNGRIRLESVKYELGKSGITTLLVEGGRQVATSFLREGAVDNITFFISPRLLGKGISSVGDLKINDLSEALVLEDWNVEVLGEDILITATPQN